MLAGDCKEINIIQQNTTGQRLSKLEADLENLEERLDKVEEPVMEIYQRLSASETCVKAIEQDVPALLERVIELEKHSMSTTSEARRNAQAAEELNGRINKILSLIGTLVATLVTVGIDILLR